LRRLAPAIGLAVLGLTFFIAYRYSGDPDASRLPFYTVLSFVRIGSVFLLSLGFGLLVGILAATNKVAGAIIIPLFDILQSIPVLGFFPIALLAFIIVLGPGVGTELAALLLLFTAMEWDIFFGVVGAVKSIPSSVTDAAKTFRITGRVYLRNVIVPAIIPALVAGSVLAWNDGWTFDIVSEFVQYGGQTYKVAGIGAYIFDTSTKNLNASWLGLLIIGEVVVLTNTLIFHRLGEKVTQHKPLIGVVLPPRIAHPFRLGGGTVRRAFSLRFRQFVQFTRLRLGLSNRVLVVIVLAALAFLGVIAYFTGVSPSVAGSLGTLTFADVAAIPLNALLSFLRMASVYIACLLVSIFAALLAVNRKGFTRYFYPLYDVGRAIPYLAVFPPLYATLAGVLSPVSSLQISSLVLIFLGMIWYILFNVVTAAEYLPTELKEVSTLFNFKGWMEIRNIIIPALMPALITGSMLAWGGGWNVIIYSEYAVDPRCGLPDPAKCAHFALPGIGSMIDLAAANNNILLLGFLLTVLAVIVLVMGRAVWRRLLRRVERYGTELT
jgi:NitT/TauT family transport system permease protein